MSLQKESEWELKLQEKIKENKFVTPSSHLDVEEIKSFIRETLATREKEIAEEVKKLIGFGKNGKDKVWVGNGNDCLYVERKAVLSLLKH